MIRRMSWTLLLLAVTTFSVSAQKPGYLGVVLGQLPDGVAGPEGAIIQEIIQDSPADRDGLRSGDVIVAVSWAEQAGLKTGDVIKAISGHDATSYIAILSLTAAHDSGDEVKIQVSRDGQTQELTVKLK